jgi:hypothetical protein
MHSTGEPVVEDGKVARLIGNTLDITEQENAIRELKKAFGEIRALKDELYKENIVLRHEIGRVGLGLPRLCDDFVHDAGKLVRVPMFPRFPPLTCARVAKQVIHYPLDLTPQRSAEDAVAPVEMHPFGILEEASEEGTKPEFRHGIQFAERLQAAKINGAKVRAVVKRLEEFAPLCGQSVYGGAASFPGLLSDF